MYKWSNKIYVSLSPYNVYYLLKNKQCVYLTGPNKYVENRGLNLYTVQAVISINTHLRKFI